MLKLRIVSKGVTRANEPKSKYQDRVDISSPCPWLPLHSKEGEMSALSFIGQKKKRKKTKVKWFKHYSDSLSDPFMQELDDKFGAQGYKAWFGLIEIICYESKKEVTGKLTISPRYLKRKLRISQGKLEQIFRFCSGKGKLSWSFVEENLENGEVLWNFTHPKILEIKNLGSQSKGDQFKKENKSGSLDLEVDLDLEKDLNTCSSTDEPQEVEDSSNSNSKPVSKGKAKVKKPTDPRIKQFIDAFANRFDRACNDEYPIAHGKDGAIAKFLVNKYSEERLQKYVEVYFTSDDRFIEDGGYSIGHFRSVLSKVIKEASGYVTQGGRRNR